MTSQEFRPQILPGSTRSLASGVPPAPPGTIFALAVDGGFAVPPRKFTLHFGRGKEDVHVPIGINDPYVSRLHGVLVCDGREWWIRNKGKLPIQLPDGAMLLSGHELLIEPGYTPLFIGSSKRRSHLLEVHVVGSRTAGADVEQLSRTKALDVYDLSLVERLVLTALAQRYLRQERYPRRGTRNGRRTRGANGADAQREGSPGTGQLIPSWTDRPARQPGCPARLGPRRHPAHGGHRLPVPGLVPEGQDRGADRRRGQAHRFGTHLDNPDLAAVARACGIHAIRVEHPDDMAAAVQDAFAHPGPALLDVVTNADEIAIPPKPTAAQAWGFAIAKIQETLISSHDPRHE
nr:FHA domain-containing protein [Kibdelosporangium aridum]